ncbi:nucleotidyltransferase domain-containing protein [Tuwongella immobilis]|uniref:Nucleotidyltransferase n=1 Tax=Tuwongella immobilis TaxID=692036 RepID=A0A6C2YI79_9BACT|nr:nucleotidyltransferase [Tuwongella immobilis]VIP01074.1 Uncharacterized protein OS=Paenibacillus sp. oral taxon 786 str. D14 GN=POTG_04203 PE=4 SV=1 [Tuwongella immobilis]VTR97573.1 Uncharacterized protein OS=Paenibacillus sp. oral taxon 786 str. D14 GN=POTG_04203 PE=4 SV=1 [Tuwongella immobilis]
MSMNPPAISKITHINAALQAICFRLQLPVDQFELARTKHEEVGAWLIHEDSPVRQYSPRVYHQGSMLIETTVRPLNRTEHDLDIICQLSAAKSMTPRQVFDLVWSRLAASPVFKDIIKPKQRCIRINFPNKFHLDVVPAILGGATSETSIYIPDMPGPDGKWKASDPKGFAKWFEEMCKKVKILREKQAVIYMSDGSVAPVPNPEPYHLKKPLKRAVQLLKRWRDMQFHGREELVTPSIVLTQLAADFYDGDPAPYEAVQIIIDRMHALFAVECPVVKNPVNDQEIISEKWQSKPECFEAFKLAIADLRDRWQKLPELKGVPVIAKELEALFGDPAVEAIQDAFAPIEVARSNSTLHVSRDTRMLVPASLPSAIKVQGHTFYGS